MGRAEVGEKRLLTVQPEEIERRLLIEPRAAPDRGRIFLLDDGSSFTMYDLRPSFYEAAKRVVPICAVAFIYSVAILEMASFFSQTLESHHYSRFCANSLRTLCSLGTLCSLVVAGDTFVLISHRIHSMISTLPRPYQF